MAKIEVNDRVLEAAAGSMLIEATDAAGIYIPRFCYHRKLSIAANCRMCLVEVVGAPKPLPACATPVADGMVVKTRSALTQAAQKSTLEFLLINHPLDCPVCDQGGECPLQDQAMGYGNDASRFVESKRAVASPDIGPLVATEMTRCIHCTRCVRFGEEVAGELEMGAPGRGEDMRIGTFLNRSIDSEVSGNMIDLCPVGALTSRPFRFSARPWELQNHHGISPHDCVGANINLQTLRNRVERVLPIDNPLVNDCWLADRDRYSYTAMNCAQRLTRPMVKGEHGWQETDWKSALDHAAVGIREVLSSAGAAGFGALAAAGSTLEEFFLLQNLTRRLGSDNVDFRLQQSDFRDDAHAVLPCSETPIVEYETVKAALLVGSNIRKEQPLLALRLRHAVVKNHARISSLNLLDYALNFDLCERATCAPSRLVAQLAALALAVGEQTQTPVPAAIAGLAGDNGLPQTAENLLQAAQQGLIVVGANAQQHADASVIKGICEWMAEACGCRLAVLPAANSVAGHLANCLPGNNGMNAQQMLSDPRQAYLLFNSEPELDSIDGKQALQALRSARFVVQISPFKSQTAMDYADVLLPLAGFAETAGTFVNCQLTAQQAKAAAPPPGEARPGWKILRVLANFLELPGFDYLSLEQVSAEIPLPPGRTPCARARNRQIAPARVVDAVAAGQLARIADMPMYRGEATLRHAAELQQTADNAPPAAHLNHATAAQSALLGAARVVVGGDSGSVTLPLVLDRRVPDNCVYIPVGCMQAVELGNPQGVTVAAATAAAPG